jgi:hypothetical protein
MIDSVSYSYISIIDMTQPLPSSKLSRSSPICFISPTDLFLLPPLLFFSLLPPKTVWRLRVVLANQRPPLPTPSQRPPRRLVIII